MALSVSFGGMGGTNFYGEIEAWQRLSGAEPTDRDIVVLRQLFRLHMTSAMASVKGGVGKETEMKNVARSGAEVKAFLRGRGAKVKKPE